MINRLMLVAIALISAIGCTTNVETGKREIDINQVQIYSKAIYPILKQSANQAIALPSFDQSKKDDLDKAIKSLDLAYANIMSLTQESARPGMIISSFASTAQGVLPFINMKPEMNLYISTALTAIQIAAPLIQARIDSK